MRALMYLDGKLTCNLDRFSMGGGDFSCEPDVPPVEFDFDATYSVEFEGQRYQAQLDNWTDGLLTGWISPESKS